MTELTKDYLRKLCRDQNLYTTAYLNDKLYLHFKGIRNIKCLDEYVGLKVLWLEGNAITEIEGLDQLQELSTLYLHENLIEVIENLEAQVCGFDLKRISSII
jgi:dynein assembly factor 1